MLDGTPVIDVHHHFVPEEVFATLRAEASGAERLVNDVLSMTLDPTLCHVDAHLEAMEVAGVDAAVLTYSALSVLGPGICQSLNDAFAGLQRAHPRVFHGAIHVDLQDPARAAAELERGANELGMRAIALPTSAPAARIDDPSLRPVWEVAEDLGLPVLLHPASLPAGASTDYGLERSCARPFDTTTAVVRLMYGVLPHHPGLRFLAPHCGGTAPYLKGRLQMFFTAPGAAPRSLPRTQRELAEEGLDVAFERLWSRIFADTAGNGGWTPVTRAALEILSPERLCFGSDFPLESHSGATLAELTGTLSALGLAPDERAALAAGNAAALLGIPLSAVGRAGSATRG
ncbi:MAG TPA: amidohydrolase family protein [Acidimicrobiales bacterium]|nr:amidohydrolase family protein [Acidimicrobiales bacterium]